VAAAAVLTYVGYAGYLGYRRAVRVRVTGLPFHAPHQKQPATLDCTAEPVLPNRLVLAWLDVIAASANSFQGSLG